MVLYLRVDFAQEAKEVTNILNGKLCLNASKSQVLGNLNNDILHFSCHGYFDKANPLSSGVQLKDSNLTAEEIFNLRIKTELVTLSACQTGISENEPGMANRAYSSIRLCRGSILSSKSLGRVIIYHKRIDD